LKLADEGRKANHHDELPGIRYAKNGGIRGGRWIQRVGKSGWAEGVGRAGMAGGAAKGTRAKEKREESE